MTNGENSTEGAELLSLRADDVQDACALIAITGIGMCRALATGLVTPEYACRRLWGPALLTRLERLGARAELCDAIHAATELEDIANVVPNRLPGAISEIETQLLNVLKAITMNGAEGDKWLPPAAGCDS